VVHTRAY